MADAVQGLDKLTKDFGQGSVEGTGEGIQDNIDYFKHFASHPIETIKKEYTEPIAKAAEELAQAFILSEKLGIANDDMLLHFGAFDIDENTQKSVGEFVGKYMDAIDKFREFYHNTSFKDKVKTTFRIFTGSGIKSAFKKGFKKALFNTFKNEAEAFKTFSKFASEKNLDPEITRPFTTLTREAIEKAQQSKPLFKKLEKEVADRFNNIAKDLPDKLRKGENDILDKMEKVGGHTIEKHVGKMNQDLIKRANKQKDIDAASTFLDKHTTTNAIQENLRNNADKIAEWIKNCTIEDIKNNNKKGFEFTHKYSVGKCTLGEKKTTIYNLTKSQVILKPDLSSEFGFIVLTSYPINK